MYAIGYDIGSSSIKIALTHSTSGKKICLLQEPSQEMEIRVPQQGWAEQDPELWWRHICTGTKKIIAQAGIRASAISTIGISYQMHGLVIVDREGRPLRDAIIWCDSRAVAIGKQAYNDLGHEWCASHLYNAPGNFTASKLKWVKENEPKVYRNIYKYMLPGDYIAYKMTGIFTTTKNGLSEGTLWNYKTNEIAVELLDHYGIDKNLTPTLVDNFSTQGKLTAQAASKLGLPQGVSLNYRSGDQPNNALSLNILKPGEVATTGGTSGVVYAVTAQKSFKEISKVNHFAHVNYTDENPAVGRLLNVNGCGIQYRWVKELLGHPSYEEMNTMAQEIAIGSDGLVILPFGNGAERMFDNKIIGTQLCNIDLNKHKKAHLCRATLEGIAFSLVYGIEILKNDGTQIHVLRAGNDNLFRSEVFATTVATLIAQDIEIYDTTGAVGASRASTVKDGDFSKFADHISNNDYIKTYQPVADKQPYRRAYVLWKEQLEKILTHK